MLKAANEILQEKVPIVYSHTNANYRFFGDANVVECWTSMVADTKNCVPGCR